MADDGLWQSDGGNLMVSYALSLYLRAQEANNELNLNNGIRDDALTSGVVSDVILIPTLFLHVREN